MLDKLDEGKKTEEQKKIDDYYKSLGLKTPDGSLPQVDTNKDEYDYTQGHGNDPYWNYETGQDDVAFEDRPWYSVFKSVRYAVYFGVVACPWIIIGAGLVATNIVINIGFNDGWAGGNIFLIS